MFSYGFRGQGISEVIKGVYGMDIELVYYNESNNSKIYVINSANKPVRLCFEGDELTESEHEDALIRLVDNVKEK